MGRPDPQGAARKVCELLHVDTGIIVAIQARLAEAEAGVFLTGTQHMMLDSALETRSAALDPMGAATQKIASLEAQLLVEKQHLQDAMAGNAWLRRDNDELKAKMRSVNDTRNRGGFRNGNGN